jgi:hypothetical protein
MAGTFLHIISFNIPYPPDYGGIIDIYFKLKALKEAGIQTILHCYTYGRQPSKELEDLCFKVHYYPRNSGLKYLFHTNPYIVATRESKMMPKNLMGDSFPVLFEGLHSTGLLIQCKEAKKMTLVRAHNIEHDYYHALAKAEHKLFQKIFFHMESRKLKRYEPILRRADYILGISKHETAYFERVYGNALFIPAFHKFEEVSPLPGTGSYLLYHGNLGVVENSGMFLRFALPALSKTSHSVVVAGKNPSKRFIQKLRPHTHIKVVADPSDQEMDELIRNAQVNLVLARQPTGIKLKLLHALFSGRHCLVNPPMVEGTGLDHLCTIARYPGELNLQLDRLMSTSFQEGEVIIRKKALKDYSNRAGAEKILRVIT